MNIVYVRNKNGVTYVYESTNYWDKDKKQSRSKRVCIGKLDDQGNLIPSKRLVDPPVTSVTKREPLPSVSTRHSYYGAVYLLDVMGQELGITQDLKNCFPDMYKQILSVVYYLILEEGSPLSRFPKWERTHYHPQGSAISSPLSSELFSLLTAEARERFFRLQGKRRQAKEYWAYATTSITSYSQSLKQVQNGLDKDLDPLPQINLALLFNEDSGLPIFYRRLVGNSSAVSTWNKLLADLKSLALGKVNLVLDPGFCSEQKVNALKEGNLKFLLATQLNPEFVQNELDKVRDSIKSRSNYNSTFQLYTHSSNLAWNGSMAWNDSQERVKGDVKQAVSMYLHLYYSSEQALEQENRFNALLDQLESELTTGSRNPEHEEQYAKYFAITETPVRGLRVTPRQDAIKNAEKDFGFFALLSNELSDPVKALDLYRTKDLVEQAFANLKERLNVRQSAVSSESALDAKLFVQFVALIYRCQLHKKMSAAGLFPYYTTQEVLDELDVIEVFDHPGNAMHVAEVTKKQAGLYLSLGVNPPTRS